MLLGGDEFLRTQQGNNNAYCQDNEISWFDWTLLEKNADIYQFWQKTISFRKRYAVLQRKTFFTGHDKSGNNIPDISWFGKECENHPWNDAGLKMICYHLDGNEADYNMSDYQLFFIFNAHSESRRVRLPHLNKMMWFQIIDTSQPVGRDFLNPEYASHIDLSQPYNTNGRSISVFLLISDNINEK